MKKLLLITISLIFLNGCSKDELDPYVNQVKPELQILNKVGIKLESSFVTSEVQMNVKLETSDIVTIRIFDISNKVVSKEQVEVKRGDNILKVYTSSLPVSAYRIGLYDSKNNQIGITDFNKIK
jgi:PBP1b-binding outer membrane lipoprotein LpoB